MKKCIITLIIFIINLSLYALETKGQLEIDSSRTNGAIVGETYSATLTLVPFNEDLLNATDLENKIFLDYFYVSRVLSIKPSDNNADALMVYLDLVLVKKFENQSFKIWPLHSRNIPVSFSINDIKKTDLIIKNFITFDTDLSIIPKFDWKAIGLTIVIVLLGIMIYFWLRKRGVSRSANKIDIARELSISQKHSDFEWLYRNRKIIAKCMEGKPQACVQFDELVNLVEAYQFQPQWREMDIGELIAKKNKTLELYKNGV